MSASGSGFNAGVRSPEVVKLLAVPDLVSPRGLIHFQSSGDTFKALGAPHHIRLESSLKFTIEEGRALNCPLFAVCAFFERRADDLTKARVLVSSIQEDTGPIRRT
jgi:hypothetical protein